MFTEEHIGELLNASLPSMIEGMKAELKQSISWEVKSAAAKLVSDAVTEWIKANIIPEIQKQLIESKEGLMTLSAALAPAMVEQLTASLQAELKEKLEKSWDRNKIFEAMFK